MREDEISAEAARRAMNLPGLSAADRKAARARIEADLRSEAEAKAAATAAATATAEASAERGRIAAVVREGQRLGKAQQALRLALAGPLDAIGARAILSTLPPDQAAPPASLALPGVGTFGGAAAQAERRRIAAVLGHPEAMGREATASAFAFDTALDPATAAIALAGVDRIKPYSGQSIAERQQEAGDFGHQPAAPDARRSTEGAGLSGLWAKAVKEVNAGFEGGDAPTPGVEAEAARSAELFAKVQRWAAEEGRQL